MADKCNKRQLLAVPASQKLKRAQAEGCSTHASMLPLLSAGFPPLALYHVAATVFCASWMSIFSYPAEFRFFSDLLPFSNDFPLFFFQKIA